MNILIATPNYNKVKGGGEISCRLLVNELKEKNHTVEVLSNLSNERVLKTIEKNIELRQIDIVHTYNQGYLPTIGKIARKYPKMCVATLNGITFSPSMSSYLFKKSSPRYIRNEYYINYYIRHIDAFTTLCPYYKQMWEQDGLKNIHVVTNMYDKEYKPLPKKKHDKFNILFVGTHSHWRRMDILEKMMVDLKKKYDVNLEVVCGDISYDEMPDIYSRVDLMVLPYSFPVPISRCIIEAMLSRVPVVTTGTDSFSPIIQDGKSGVLVWSCDTELFVDSVSGIIEDDDKRKLLSDNGFKRVKDVCCPSKIVDGYIKVYQQLLNQ